MTGERWVRLESIFHSALDREASDRDSYLEEACGGDPELLREVQALLACNGQSSFLKEDAITAALRALETRAAFEPGQQLGPYRIEDKVAAGGMGVVYRALDTRLQRPVALKVLRPGLLGEKGRSLLQREAQSIAQLQHPNICALHDIGEQDGRDYLVMEYLAGGTLADRLRRKPLDVAQALEYATQIAAALEQAHRRGVIHRDLKPGNVMITKTGAKLLDFGLAALRRSAPSSGPDKAVTELTLTGTMIGTLPYMAPEQVRGEPVDARTDIFAFGLVLYEMLTGQRAYPQTDRAELASAILNQLPPPVPGIPVALERVLTISLAKEPDDRWQSAGDLKRELTWIAGAAIDPQPARRKWRIALAVATAALCVTAAGVAGYRAHPTPVAQTARFSVLPPEGSIYPSLVDLAISPDGQKLVFSAMTSDGKAMLWLRHLDELTARILPGTEDAQTPFWSPDSRYLAFFSHGRLSRMDPSGGIVETISSRATGRGGAWGPNNKILFNRSSRSELQVIDASGGRPAPATVLSSTFQDFQHIYPSFLPDGRHFLFYALGDRHRGMIYVGSLDSKEAKFIRRSTGRAQYRNGRLYFIEGGLKSQPFDLKRLELTGQPTTLTESLELKAGYDISQTGTIAYRLATPSTRELVWLDLFGKQGSKPFGSDQITSLAVSPDGKNVAVVLGPEDAVKISLWKLPLLQRSALTDNPSTNDYPVWSPDSRRIAFSSDRNGRHNIFVRSLDSSGPEQPLAPSDTEKVPESWSPDSKYLSATEMIGTLYRNWVIPLADPGSAYQFPVSGYSISMGIFSRDGKWMAYWSDETGTAEVYVINFPDGLVRRQISTDGGQYPKWTSDGKTLCYINARKQLIAVPISAQGNTLQLGQRRQLGELPRSFVGAPYSIADDNRILAMFDPESALPRPIIVVMNAASAQ